PTPVRLQDIATAWLGSRGRTGQWGDGTVKHAENPECIERSKEFAESGGAWRRQNHDEGELKNINGVVGGLVVGRANPYVAPATEPELYVNFLATDRRSGRKGIGALLLEKARALAREMGVGVLRLDCYAGNGGGLVRYYEPQGFERGESFEVTGWPGLIMVRRLDKEGEGR
ncbi:hypothetical protein BU23DRAFT_636068, partial [Bimuria novae-zelandiae CBS 107.79]